MNRNLILLTLALATWGTGESMFLYFQPLYLQNLGADPVKIGVILGIAGVATVCVHIPAGYLADRFGRRPLLRSSWIMGLIAAWTMALAKSLPVFVGGMLIYSCTYFVMAPMNSYITAARGEWSVGRALTVVMAAFSFGSILGPIVGGRIADKIGLHSIYLISGCIFILSTCIIFFLQAQPLDHAAGSEPNGGIEINRRYLAFLGIIFITMFAAYLPQPLSSNFLHNVRGLSYSQIGQLGSISSLGMVVLSLIMARLNHHLGFIIGQATVALFTLLLWQGNAFLLFAAGYFFMGGFRVAHSFISAQTNELVHQSRMGLAYGLTETVFSIALMCAPPLAGYLYAINPSLTYTVSFGLILLTLVLLILYYYRPHFSLFSHEERSIEA